MYRSGFLPSRTSPVESLLSVFFFCLNYLTPDSHYNFCRLTKIVSSANKFAYGYVSFGLPALSNISCRVFAIGFLFCPNYLTPTLTTIFLLNYCKPKKNCLLNSAPFSLYSLLALSPASLAFTSR